MGKSAVVDPAVLELKRFKASVKRLAEKYDWIEEYERRFEQKPEAKA